MDVRVLRLRKARCGVIGTGTYLRLDLSKVYGEVVGVVHAEEIQNMSYGGGVEDC